MAKRVKHGKAYNIGQNMVRIVGNNPNITDGVSIGANTSDNLRVDNNEVLIGANASKSGKTLYPTDNNIRVLSAQPMFDGVSPVQLLYGGMAPDIVFAMQEGYKDVHGINDDGSRQNAQFGILKKIKQSINKHNNDKRQTPLKGIDWSGIKTTNDRAYNQEYINYINDSLVNYGYNNNQRAAILANIIEESGGDPFAEGPGGYYGLLQWGSDRYTKTKEKDVYKEIDNQLKYLHGTISETKDKKSWTHGGKGSGYNSFTDAMDAYNSDELNKVMHGFTWGYVRPAGKQNSYLNRQKVADQLINLEGFRFGGRKRFQTGGDGNVPTEEEYITHKIDSIRTAALNKSRTRTTPKVPYGFKEDQIKYANYAKHGAITNRDYAKILLEKYDNSDSYINHRRLQLLREASELDKKAENYITGKEKAPGASCIYTATDNYGNKYLVASNQLFAKNPLKYGFTKIKVNDAKPGDIFQHVPYGVPTHAMILDSFNNEGVPLFNYSNGGTEEKDIVKQGHYLRKDLLNDDVANVYRFVGTPADSLLWRNEYQQKYGKKFGGQTSINSLGERPNAKYGKEMKNKRNKAINGRQQFSISGLPAFDFTVPNTFGNYNLNKPFYPTYVDGPLIGLRVPQSTLNVPAFPTNFSPKSTVGQVDPFMGTKPAFGTSTTETQKTNSVGDLTKDNGPSTTAISAIGAIGNTAASLLAAGIQQNAINNLEAPKRQYTLLNPVKLKTKININPQIARMREIQAQLADAARRTSGSSRTAYQKMLAGHNRLLDSSMDLYGRKENIETELINRDRLNQQQVVHTNATNVMNTVNYNNEAATEMRNRKRVATSNNWTTALNTTAGAWAGPNGFIDRANALRVKAGELYTQAIANPTAARLLYGDIDFTTGANKRKAFNTIYDFLNNNRFA